MKKLYASHADRWIKCPSYEHRHDKSKKDTHAAVEGIAAAWVADMVLKNDTPDIGDMLGETALNGYDITPDMITHISGYVDYVRKKSENRNFKSEERYHDTTYNIIGRVDSIIDTDPKILHIVDLKYGYGIVEPYDNWQFIAYGYLAMTPEIETVKFTVYQPRPNHPAGRVRTAIYTRGEFSELATQLVTAARAAQQDVTIAVPSPVCNLCAKSGTCAALLKNVYAAHEIITEFDYQGHLTAEQLSAEYKFVTEFQKLISAHLAGIESELETRLASGEFIPGYYSTPSMSNKYFDVKPDVIEMLTGCDPYKKILKTPAELERDGADPEIIKSITNRRINSFKVTEHNPKKTERLFKK